MNDVSFSAFVDELAGIEMAKTAGLRDLWQRFVDLFRVPDEKAKRRVEYHFSPKAGSDKWNKFAKNIRDPNFVERLSKHPDADSTLITHAKALHGLSRSPTVGKIKSSRLPGRTYEIRDLGGGNLGCTCNDWRFKGSLSPGYECKHIRAHKQGKAQAN